MFEVYYNREGVMKSFYVADRESGLAWELTGDPEYRERQRQADREYFKKEAAAEAVEAAAAAAAKAAALEKLQKVVVETDDYKTKGYLSSKGMNKFFTLAEYNLTGVIWHKKDAYVDEHIAFILGKDFVVISRNEEGKWGLHPRLGLDAPLEEKVAVLMCFYS